MQVSDFTRNALKVRKDRRDMERAGWELVGEGGGRLWELYRGGRWRHEITDAKVAACGKAIWIKTEERA